MPIHCQLHDKSDHKVLLYSDVAVVSGEQKQSCMLCPESFWISWTTRGRPRSQRKRNEGNDPWVHWLVEWEVGNDCSASHFGPIQNHYVHGPFFAQPAENLESHAHLGCTSSSSNAGFRFIHMSSKSSAFNLFHHLKMFRFGWCLCRHLFLSLLQAQVQKWSWRLSDCSCSHWMRWRMR